jgi:hyperosmotically inducible protein
MKMKRTTMYLSLAGALMFSAAAFGISSAVDSPRTLMSRGDHAAASKAIESETRVRLGRCRDAEGVSHDVCKAEVRAEERVKKADLDARYYGTAAAAADAKLARAKAHYEVAKAKCGGYSSDRRADCMQSARAEKARALADAKLASI